MAKHSPDELRADSDDARGRAAPRTAGVWPLAIVLVLAAAAALGWWWWSARRIAPVAVTAPASAPAAAQPAASAASSGPAHPLAATTEAPLTPAQVESALVEAFGAQAVKSFLQTDDFPRRAAATADNLGRSHAPSAAWPVRPTPGRFAVDEGPQGTAIAASNAQRYEPFVRWAGSIDAGKAVALYRRMYPLLQHAYRELGFGDRYLNDRVIEVIDLLLATPEPAQPPQVQLQEVKGPFPSERPWLRYQYVDPQLESLAAGQKILVRVGVDNERILKRKLREIRAALVATAGAAPAR